ncbi:DUF3459 domain-containing protein, partial [Halomonas sp. BM-2019]|uniref:alpha-amylase family glycosyl hydrolase n=1 Tax=Halomonas sp. BM-2019 TaxID=2811227 RepID=UPI001B3C2334
QRGSVCLYQGEELGLTEAELAFEQLVDPAGITFWPSYKGRDGCRTPMPWVAEAPHGGFSGAMPWLPVPEEHLPLAVDRQERDSDSLLNAYRAFLAFRRTQPALIKGDIHYQPLADDVIRFERRHGDERLLVALNFADEPRRLAAPTGAEGLTEAPDWINGRWSEGRLELPAFGIAIARCPSDTRHQ